MSRAPHPGVHERIAALASVPLLAVLLTLASVSRLDDTCMAQNRQPIR